MRLLPSLFARALSSRNYRLYFAGQLVSLAGTWMQQIAMVWLAYRLSDSVLVLGLVGFASQIPILLLGPVAGVLTDRFDRRRILLTTQAMAMTQALLLALLTWQQWVSAPWLIGMGFLLGCINALDIPARQAFSVQLVDKREDLPNAIALNSLLMNATRFIGPALAGFAVAAIGEALCFVVNAASYLAVLLALLAIDSRSPAGGGTTSARQALREGFRYVLDHGDIRAHLALVATISLLVTPYAVMMPMFAREIFGGDASTYGLLIASAGAGSLLGSLYLAGRRGTTGLAGRVRGAMIAAGCALALFAMNRVALLAFPIVMALGGAVILVIAGSNTLIQTWLEDSYRGRVMAIFSMAFLGIAPLGSMAVGGIGHLVGVPVTLLACGLLTAVVGLLARRQGTPSRNA